MKRPMLSILLPGSLLGLILSACSLSALAQGQEPSAKNLYLAHARDARQGRPGVRITVELKRDGVSRKVPLNHPFRAGDRVKFHFETNFKAYVRIINVGSTGALQLLYPYRGAAELVSKTKDYAIPQGDLWLEFDRNPGREQLTFVFSSLPLQTEPRADRTAQRPAPESEQQLAELNSRSLENGKDFSLVPGIREDASYAYGVAAAQTMRKPIGIRITLSHE
ncbi:MAG TPA: DUF4384 domain-containing protein [Blastocatellia bacterium]|nr:DUF4384 domain-containing protein [Blastocatellia bacterium]